MMDESAGITHSGTTVPSQSNHKSTHQAIVWRNVLLFAYLHLAALYGVLLMFTSAKIATTIFGMLKIPDNIIDKLFKNIFCLFIFSNFYVSSIFNWHYCWSS